MSTVAEDFSCRLRFQRRVSSRWRSAVRDGVACEFECTEAHDARLNAHALPAKQQKNGPEQVRELSGQDKRPQRGPWRNLFRRQCHTKMAQKQPSLLSSLVAGPGWSGRLFGARPDRKSTRLNSSHSSISYA